MANTTFQGPVRSENGFVNISKDAATGTVTVLGGSGSAAVPANMTPGPGITGGVGTVYKYSVSREGDIIITRIMIDLTGLNCGGTAGDIIGDDGTGAAYLCQIKAAVNGTIFGGEMLGLEAPTTGDPDIDLYSAVEATGVEDTAIGALTETQLTNGGDVTVSSRTTLTAMPAADEYLYLVCGTATAGTYDAGKLLITLYGYAA